MVLMYTQGASMYMALTPLTLWERPQHGGKEEFTVQEDFTRDPKPYTLNPKP